MPPSPSFHLSIISKVLDVEKFRFCSRYFVYDLQCFTIGIDSQQPDIKHMAMAVDVGPSQFEMDDLTVAIPLDDGKKTSICVLDVAEVH